MDVRYWGLPTLWREYGTGFYWHCNGRIGYWGLLTLWWTYTGFTDNVMDVWYWGLLTMWWTYGTGMYWHYDGSMALRVYWHFDRCTRVYWHCDERRVLGFFCDGRTVLSFTDIVTGARYCGLQKLRWTYGTGFNYTAVDVLWFTDAVMDVRT